MTKQRKSIILLLFILVGIGIATYTLDNVGAEATTTHPPQQRQEATRGNTSGTTKPKERHKARKNGDKDATRKGTEDAPRVGKGKASPTSDVEGATTTTPKPKKVASTTIKEVRIFRRGAAPYFFGQFML